MPHEAEHTPTSTAEDEGPLWSPIAHRRLALALICILCIVLLVVLPPYISISRYQRRVTTAISGALGRPVHFDRISLHLLPLPGLTIENFVVSESPDFGSEPVLRANTVEARLRFASLWRRRIEVSRISLEAPSVNLTRRTDTGTWNVQSIVLQASHLNSAPTAQRTAGPAPRFPYIEATDARINIKNGIDKLPFSIRDAEFALWLPEPGEWRVRLAGRPVRTDTDVSDVGLLRVEGTLGRASDIASAPIDLQVNWKPTPLGEAAKLSAGRDLGWRGSVSGEARLHGTIGSGQLIADAHLRNLRRADFVPAETMDLDAHCEAITAGLLRGLHDIRCAIPTSTDKSVFSLLEGLGSGAPVGDRNMPGVLRVSGDLPNLLNWRTATLDAELRGAKPDYALEWMRLFSGRIPPDAKLDGSWSLSASKEADTPDWKGQAACQCVLPSASVAQQHSPPGVNRWYVALVHALGDDPFAFAGSVIAPREATTPSDPASAPDVFEAPDGRPVAQIEGNRDQIAISYGQAEDAQLLAHVLPQLSDNLPRESAGALRSVRSWTGFQAWSTPAPSHARPIRKHGRTAAKLIH